MTLQRVDGGRAGSHGQGRAPRGPAFARCCRRRHHYQPLLLHARRRHTRRAPLDCAAAPGEEEADHDAPRGALLRGRLPQHRGQPRARPAPAAQLLAAAGCASAGPARRRLRRTHHHHLVPAHSVVEITKRSENTDSATPYHTTPHHTTRHYKAHFDCAADGAAADGAGAATVDACSVDAN